MRWQIRAENAADRAERAAHAAAASAQQVQHLADKVEAVFNKQQLKQ
ncbi:MAG: hypothetical protein R6U40_08480 [Desulfobacterales bacterium]